MDGARRGFLPTQEYRAHLTAIKGQCMPQQQQPIIVPHPKHRYIRRAPSNEASTPWFARQGSSARNRTRPNSSSGLIQSHQPSEAMRGLKAHESSGLECARPGRSHVRQSAARSGRAALPCAPRGRQNVEAEGGARAVSATAFQYVPPHAPPDWRLIHSIDASYVTQTADWRLLLAQPVVKHLCATFVTTMPPPAHSNLAQLFRLLQLATHCYLQRRDALLCALASVPVLLSQHAALVACLHKCVELQQSRQAALAADIAGATTTPHGHRPLLHRLRQAQRESETRKQSWGVHWHAWAALEQGIAAWALSPPCLAPIAWDVIGAVDCGALMAMAPGEATQLLRAASRAVATGDIAREPPSASVRERTALLKLATCAQACLQVAWHDVAEAERDWERATASVTCAASTLARAQLDLRIADAAVTTLEARRSAGEARESGDEGREVPSVGQHLEREGGRPLDMQILRAQLRNRAARWGTGDRGRIRGGLQSRALLINVPPVSGDAAVQRERWHTIESSAGVTNATLTRIDTMLTAAHRDVHDTAAPPDGARAHGSRQSRA